VRKDFKYNCHSSLYSVLEDIKDGWLNYKVHSLKDESVMKSAYACLKRNHFHTPLDESEFSILGIKRKNSKKWTIDEVFGRTNMAYQAIVLFDNGNSIDDVMKIMKPTMLQCYLTKKEIINNNKEMDINQALRLGLQSKIKKEIWTEDFVQDYIEKYLKFVRNYNFDPFDPEAT